MACNDIILQVHLKISNGNLGLSTDSSVLSTMFLFSFSCLFGRFGLERRDSDYIILSVFTQSSGTRIAKAVVAMLVFLRIEVN